MTTYQGTPVLGRFRLRQMSSCFAFLISRIPHLDVIRLWIRYLPRPAFDPLARLILSNREASTTPTQKRQPVPTSSLSSSEKYTLSAFSAAAFDSGVCGTTSPPSRSISFASSPPAARREASLRRLRATTGSPLSIMFSTELSGSDIVRRGRAETEARSLGLHSIEAAPSAVAGAAGQMREKGARGLPAQASRRSESALSNG